MEAGGATRAKALRFPRETCHMQGTARRSGRLEVSEQEAGKGSKDYARPELPPTGFGPSAFSECHMGPERNGMTLPVFTEAYFGNVWGADFRGSERQDREQLGGCGSSPGERSPWLPGESESSNPPQSGAHSDHQEVL